MNGSPRAERAQAASCTPLRAAPSAFLFPALLLLLLPPAFSHGDPPRNASPNVPAVPAPSLSDSLIDAATGRPDLQRLLDHLDDLYRANSSFARMTLTVKKPRRTRAMTLKAWSKGEDKALILVEQPARDAGTATLKVGKNLWNYLPRIARTIRIPPSMMLSSWMGSDFTNDDLVRESSLLDDFEGTLVGQSDSPPGWLVNLKAKPDTVGLWDRIEYVISADGTLPIQARYYDRREELARVMDFSHVREFDGRRIPTRLLLTPVDKDGHETVMVYEDVRFNLDVPESLFSLSQLERKR
ncbi:MAG: outer membrane lipoprotein-sorting protein [Kiritimatiellae bacterium]|nr:outer membrane lipoprotein-sorting protein [Kiritimatiellia bacterium]